MLRQPVTAMLFQRGAFTAESTEMVSWALLWYTAGLVGHSVVEILSRAFYALHDTKTPVSVGVAAMGLNAVFSFGFAALFSSVGWMPHGGLALANSLATALEAVILFMIMRRRLNGIDGANIARGLGQFGLASLGMAIGILLWVRFTGNLNPWLIGLGGVTIGGVVYGLGAALLKVPEIQMVFSMLRKRLPGS
jgi:putative peptidoglycan lipid II flippase